MYKPHDTNLYDMVFITYRMRFCTVMKLIQYIKEDLVHNVLGLFLTILDGQHLLYQ